MESIRAWFQDWSDACEYAKECWPDLSFAALSEPWSAFVAIAALCYFIWLLNEIRLNGLLGREKLYAEAQVGGARRSEAGLAVSPVKALHPLTENRQAA